MQLLCFAYSQAHRNKIICAAKQLFIGQLQSYRFDSWVLLIHAKAAEEPLLFALGEAAGPAAGAAEQAVFLMVLRQIFL